MMRLWLLLVVCWSASSGLIAGELRAFKSADGREMRAEIVSATKTAVTIRNERGTLYRDVSLDKFSPEDRAFVHQWLKEQAEKRDNAEIHRDARVRLSFSKRRDDDFNEYGDIDDRIVSLSPGVVIESLEHEVSYTGVKGTIVMIGRGVLQQDAYVILSKQDFSLDIPCRETVRWSGMGFECSYDPDYGGYEYEGYLLVLRDRSGRIVISKASKSGWERAPEALLKAEVRTGYDSSFDRTKTLRTTWGLPK